MLLSNEQSAKRPVRASKINVYAVADDKNLFQIITTIKNDLSCLWEFPDRYNGYRYAKSNRIRGVLTNRET